MDLRRVLSYVRRAAEDYEMIRVERIQIFANTETDQNLEFIPLAEFPESYNTEEIFITTPQTL